MNRKNSIIGLIALTLMVMACSGGTTSEDSSTTDLSGNDYLVTIKTDLGEMKAVLYDKTPQHKENFLKLVNDGFYDSLMFHRVIQGFMIQGGDPNSKNAAPGQRLGNGGPGYTIPAEFVPELFHKKGALSAARLSDQQNPERASSGSQFYIVQGQVTPREMLEGPNQGQMVMAFQQLMQSNPSHPLAQEYNQVLQENPGNNAAIEEKVRTTIDRLSEATGMPINEMSAERIDAYSTVGGTPSLDDQYTVFGEVISGLEVIDSIAAVQTAPGDRPVEDVRMYISVEEMPKAEISKEYGYQY